MDRRQFLVRSASVGGALLGRKSFRYARRNLIPGDESAPAERVLPRADAVSGAVTGVGETSVSLDVRCSEPRDAFEVLVRRREYPSGAVLGSTVSDLLRATDAEQARTVDVEIPRAGRHEGAWFYEAYVRPAETEEVGGYLCESAPLRWCGAADDKVAAAERVADPKPRVDTARFKRRRAGNDYALTFRWLDSERAIWAFDYRLRRSTHDAAVARERGYTTTYEASQSNPVVRDFAAALQRNATSDDVTDGDDADAETGGSPVSPASLDAGRRFDVLVQFVQGLRYARDAATVDAYDYHRTVEETLAAGVGDCKDRSYLLAGLLSAAFDCETTLLFQTGHVLLGVDPDTVPSLPYDVDTLSLGGREYLAIDPSLRGPIDVYPDFPFVAAYSDGTWVYHDASAMSEGVDDVVRDYLQNAGVMPQVF